MSTYVEVIKAIEELRAEGFVVDLRPEIEYGAVRAIDPHLFKVEIAEDRLTVEELLQQLQGAKTDIESMRWQGRLGRELVPA
jgi:hypothetical protein